MFVVRYALFSLDIFVIDRDAGKKYIFNNMFKLEFRSDCSSSLSRNQNFKNEVLVPAQPDTLVVQNSIKTVKLQLLRI